MDRNLGLEPERRKALTLRKVAEEEKRRKAYLLRSQGYDYEDIAKALGWASRASAFRACQRYLKLRAQEDVEEVRMQCIDATRKVLASTKQDALKLKAIMNIYKMSGLDVQQIKTINPEPIKFIYEDPNENHKISPDPNPDNAV